MNLNSIEEIKKIDTGDVLTSIQSFAQQVEQAWTEASALDLPADFNNVKNILIVGMGGSALGADILRNLFKDRLKVPVVVSNDYHIPAFVGSETLVLLLSYSGTTEEVLTAAGESQAKNAKIVVVTVGGELGKLENSLVYAFDPTANPSAQPRLGLGYTLTAALAILSKLGLMQLEKDPAATVQSLKGFTESLGVEAVDNQAKTLAQKMFGKEIVIVGAEFLSGNAHVFANQTNENAKNFANYFVLPELNHHLLEGLTDPKSLSANLHFVFLDSEFYSEKIQKRMNVTKEVLGKLQICYSDVAVQGEDKLTQVLNYIIFSSFATFYLGVLNGVDPVKIPWVDYFKKRLAE